MLPADTERLLPGDEILFCSRAGAEQQIRAQLANVYTLGYLVSGAVPPRSTVLARLTGKRRVERAEEVA